MMTERKPHHPVRKQAAHEARVFAVVALIIIAIWVLKGLLG